MTRHYKRYSKKRISRKRSKIPKFRRRTISKKNGFRKSNRKTRSKPRKTMKGGNAAIIAIASGIGVAAILAGSSLMFSKNSDNNNNNNNESVENRKYVIPKMGEPPYPPKKDIKEGEKAEYYTDDDDADNHGKLTSLGGSKKR